MLKFNSFCLYVIKRLTKMHKNYIILLILKLNCRWHFWLFSWCGRLVSADSFILLGRHVINMSDFFKTVIGILLPFAGTTLGSAMIFFMKGDMKPRLQKMLLGFASGVMIAASVWSLLIPAIEMSSEHTGSKWIPAAVSYTHLDVYKRQGIYRRGLYSGKCLFANPSCKIPKGRRKAGHFT